MLIQRFPSLCSFSAIIDSYHSRSQYKRCNQGEIQPHFRLPQSGCNTFFIRSSAQHNGETCSRHSYTTSEASLSGVFDRALFFRFLRNSQSHRSEQYGDLPDCRVIPLIVPATSPLPDRQIRNQALPVNESGLPARLSINR